MAVDPRIGLEIGGYRIESLLGRGGMASVYLAEHLRLQRKVALKLLASDLAGDVRFHDRFLRESQLAASLDHPNVIPIFDADEADGVLYIAMRYVEGRDLRTLLQSEGTLEPLRALGIVAQAAAGLDAAHRRGLVHRDVKPGNILIGEDDHVYVSDFGLTKQASSQTGLTATGQLVGTVDYVAPEQIQGQEVDGRTDLYSLGCVFYECLAGAKPFVRDTEVATIWAHIQDPPPALSAIRPDLPKQLDDVLAKAMAKRPDSRYSTCRELVDSARRELGISSGEISTPTLPRRRRRRLQLAAAAALAAAAIAAFAVATVGGGAAKTLTPVAPNSVAVVDPAKNRVTDVISVGSLPGQIATGTGHIWLVNAGDRTVASVDLKTHSVQTISAGDNPVDIAPGAVTWISGDGSGALTRIEGSDASTVQIGRVSEARSRARTDLQSVAEDTRFVWVLDTGIRSGLIRVDQVSGNVDARTAGFSGAQDLLLADGGLWIADTSVGQVARVDPRTMLETTQISVPTLPLALAAGGGAIWVVSPSAAGGGRLWRIDPRANVPTGTANVGNDAAGVAFGAGSVWVMHSRTGIVSRVDPHTLQVVKTIPIGNHPGGIAFAGGRLYVAVDEANQYNAFELSD